MLYMDNQYNNQQQYAAPVQQQTPPPVQQPPVQPQYQQPYQPQQPVYQPQPQPKPQGEGLQGLVDFMAKLLPVLIIVFLGIGALSVLYYFIMGIANAASYGGFGAFVGGIANGISSAARYIFYAAIMAVGAKRIKK